MDEKELFNKENIPASNWFKFDKVGDRVFGEVVEIFENPAVGDFPAQICFALKQKDESVINVGVKKFKKDGVSASYIAERTKNVKWGDFLGFEFKEEIPPKVKGHHPAKSIEVFVKHMNKEKPAEAFGPFDQ